MRGVWENLHLNLGIRDPPWLGGSGATDWARLDRKREQANYHTHGKIHTKQILKDALKKFRSGKHFKMVHPIVLRFYGFTHFFSPLDKGLSKKCT